jgi:hypothetical protein
MYSFSKEPIEGEEEPLRKGNLLLDFDSEKTPFDLIKIARAFIDSLEARYNVSGRLFNYWLSGKKGCHVEIPGVLYGDIYGDPYLPQIHRLMIETLLSLINIDKRFIDLNIYNMKKGRLIRLENTPREDHLGRRILLAPFSENQG